MSEGTKPRPAGSARLGTLRKSTIAIAVAGALALVGAGCGSGGSSSTGAASTGGGSTASTSKPFTVGLMVQSQKLEFFVEQIKQVRSIVQQHGGKLVVMDPDNDPTKQLQLAQDWLNGHTVDAIIGLPLDVNAFQPVLDQATKDRVPVVPWGSDPKVLHPGQTTINQDFHDWGMQAGAAMAKCIDRRLGGKAQVAIIGGPDLPGPIVTARIAGIKDGVTADAPGARIVAEANGGNDQLRSEQAMETILQAHPDVNAFGGTGDDAVLGIMKALQKAGKDPTRLCLIGMDGTAEGEAAFKAGKFYAEGDLNLPVLYEQAVTAVQAMLKDFTDPKYSQQRLLFKVRIKTLA